MSLAEAGVTLGALCALGSALTWALIGLVARALSPYFNALSINMLRSALGGALLAAVVLARGGLESLREVPLDAWVYLSVSILTGFAAGDTMFFESSKRIGLARALTISMAYPLIASLLAVWLFGERVTTFLALGAVVTLAGLAVIVGDEPAAAAPRPAARAGGLTLALLAAAAWAVSTTLMKPAVRTVDPITVQAVRLPLAALALWATPWARGAGARFRAHRGAVAPLVVALGVLTALSAVLFITGLKYAGVALTTILSSTSPLFALPIGLALGERVTWRAAAGAGLSIAGLALLAL